MGRAARRDWPWRSWRPIIAALGFALTAGVAIGAGRAGAQLFTPAPSPSPSRYLVARMGIEMSEAEARHGIGFRPFAPPREIVATALLAPFHGDDTRANRGIGFEYADETGRLYALAQWPRNGGSLVRFGALRQADARCPGAHAFGRGAKLSGIVWSTPHGRILSLAADGKNDARTLGAEWRQLIQRGACR